MANFQIILISVLKISAEQKVMKGRILLNKFIVGIIYPEISVEKSKH